jgi:anti-sigma factor RsiW
VIRYLLGELPEGEQRRYEESYLADDDLFAELLTIEAELIDSYARGALAPHERERFERYFLRSAERRARVAFAISLLKMVEPE